MERHGGAATAAAAAARRPLGLVGKIMAQQPAAALALGNQSYDDDEADSVKGNRVEEEEEEESAAEREDDSDDSSDAPERGGDSVSKDEQELRGGGASEAAVVERFRSGSSSSASSSSWSAPSTDGGERRARGYGGGVVPSVATPPSSPESQSRKCADGGEATPEDPDASDAFPSSEDEEPAASEARDSIGSDTDASLPDDIKQSLSSETDHEQQQLESDMHVLAAHLQQQTLALTHERSVNQSLQSHLLETEHRLTREIESVLVENDALRHQHAALQAAQNASEQRAQTASEAHDELLRALQTQQQREDHARTIIVALVKERDALKKQLDESKTYCRRLEEDVVTLRAEQQNLRAETATLTTALAAATSRRNDRELETIRAQEELIASLRADLLQMEFEYTTLRVDKDKLHTRVATLQRQSESQTQSYDVISLGASGKGAEARRKTKRLSLSGVTGGKDNDKGRGSGKDGGVSFTNLMTLPNCVQEDGASARTASTPSMGAVPRPRTPVGSLVSKTLSSAKKKLFQSSAHTATVVIPQ